LIVSIFLVTCLSQERTGSRPRGKITISVARGRSSDVTDGNAVNVQLASTRTSPLITRLLCPKNFPGFA
jgi:hypothetical protein